jgi:thymidylate synthase (FAD)
MPEEQIKAIYENHMGNDLTCANAARVSFGKRSSMYEDEHGVWRLKEGDKRLIQFLARGMTSCEYDTLMWEVMDLGYEYLEDKLWQFRDTGEHKSPFNHCFATFVVEAPIFVRSQLIKHEYLVVNEVSRRYVDTDPEFYTPNTWRNKAANKKQGSSGVNPMFNHGVGTGYREEEYEHNDRAIELYRRMLELGVAPEQARMVLPQSMMTQWWWSGSLGAFAKMCRLRLAPDAQYESRLVAQQISNKMLELYPVSWKALVLREFN